VESIGAGMYETMVTIGMVDVHLIIQTATICPTVHFFTTDTC
jgi:hypothetical protein